MILLLTHSEDFYTIDLVKESLKIKGFNSVRINIDSFPTQINITKTFNYPFKPDKIQLPEKTINIKNIEGVWLRKYWGPKVNTEIDPLYRNGCTNESTAVINGLFYTLNHVPWIDPLEKVRFAENKMVQLDLAQKSGIRIPQTLITNNPADLKKFYHDLSGEVVVKMLTSLSSSMKGSSFFMYTSKVEPEHIKDASLLELCPLTFQEQIHKEYELRVMYVDGYFFTGKINTGNSQFGKIDGRLSKINETKWERYELPEKICKQMDLLMNKLGLTYGAIDVIKSVNNEYVFLEVNPIGEWGMLQKDLGYPIAETIADSLIKKVN